jgi:hypothetical protein
MQGGVIVVCVGTFPNEGLGRRISVEFELAFLVCWLACLFSFEEQVVADPDIATSHLIGVQTPSVALPFLNCSSDVLVVADLDTFILLQSTCTPGLATAYDHIWSSVRVTDLTE